MLLSEAELHQIRMRLHQGERQKAARGKLRLPLPAGLVHDRSGTIILNPDEEVQARLRLVFAKFRELQSARAVMRYLRANGLPLPVRPLLGLAPHALVWREADSPRVRNILPTTSTAVGARIRAGVGRDQPVACGEQSLRQRGAVPEDEEQRQHGKGEQHDPMHKLRAELPREREKRPWLTPHSPDCAAGMARLSCHHAPICMPNGRREIHSGTGRPAA